MNLFEQLMYFFEYKLDEAPGNYGRLHISFLIMMTALTVFLCFKYKNASDKKFRMVLLPIWLTMVILEIYKNIHMSVSFSGMTATWEYPPYIFPFQFCSTPLYVLPFVIFMKNGKVRDACIAFSCTFALFAGLAVYAYPGGIFVRDITISIQSLIHHGLQVVSGIFIFVYSREKLKPLFLLKAVICFVVLVCVAMALNFIGPKFTDRTFNMFYISPFFRSSLPILHEIYPLVPYPVFLLIYLLGFTAAATIVFYSGKGIVKLSSKNK
ncbi:MAG: YwaF family protein [Bacilli bacterium]|nr:YwaF family protein [Bacilli bacterium]